MHDNKEIKNLKTDYVLGFWFNNEAWSNSQMGT